MLKIIKFYKLIYNYYLKLLLKKRKNIIKILKKQKKL